MAPVPARFRWHAGELGVPRKIGAGYETSDGIDPQLLAQFPLLEDALSELGIVVWPMVELEADDALGAAAARATEDPRVERVIILHARLKIWRNAFEDGAWYR